MNFDNMEPDYKKDEESDLQKMARQTNKNVFLAVTAGVFISLGFAAIIFIVFLNMGFITLNKFNADGTRRDTDGTTKLTEIQDKMQNFYYSDNVDPEALKDAMYKGYVSAYGDPYTTYYTADEYTQLMSSYKGAIGGIGVRVSYEKGTGLKVSSVEENSPAAQAGIQAGDVITAIDGNDITNLDENPVDNLRGEEGSEVNVTYSRNGESNTVKLTRIQLTTTTAAGTMLEGTTIGYIAVTHFEDPTSEQFANAVKDLESKGMTGLIIDLRDNTGGLVASSVKILDTLMPEGVYGTQVFKDGSKVELTGTNADAVNVPVVLLVNENTASASELTAGALQSEKGYQLIGKTTYGKGSAQTQKTLSDGSVLKYTYAKWMIPNGTCINGKGLTPDEEVDNVSLSGVTTKDVKETLKVDCVNTRIKSMQKMLNILGYSVDREDGYFSVNTQVALQQFETDNHLNVDGEYSQSDKQMLVARMMIYINNHENDKQYDQLMKIIK